MRRALVLTIAAGALAILPAAARADGIRIGVGFGVPYYPRPHYHYGVRVYAPVYFGPPPVVYVSPPPPAVYVPVRPMYIQPSPLPVTNCPVLPTNTSDVTCFE